MRLIDANALMRDVDDIVDTMSVCINMDYCNGMRTMKDLALHTVERAPTIDAVPVVHGEWTNRRTWTHDGEWYCTACDKEITIYMGEKRGNDRYKYCPNCGAKMKTVTDCHTLEEGER